MAKPRKERISFGGKGSLALKSSGGEVSTLQALLASIGHLRGSYVPGTFCQHTQRAVRRYQRFYDLKPDGIAGPVTKGHMEQRRCGVPDFPVAPGGELSSAPYVLRGCQYNKKELTYAFLNDTPDMPGSRAQDIVRNAFGTWAGVADLQFIEVNAGNSPDFRIAWRSGNHGDGSGFDGPGNTLAHAFFPPPCGGPNAGDLHFDEAERWIEDPGASGILLQQVAIHEIGHLLGLSHSRVQAAIMYAYYAPDRVNLHQDDIAGIRALYGEPAAVTEVQLVAQANGRLRRAGEEALFQVPVSNGLAVSLDGPANADFDLYVRKDQPPTENEWDYRAYTMSSDEQITFPAEVGAKYFVMVKSYQGSGDFALKVQSAVV